MPYEEFLKWSQYFDMYPVGWREDERTLKLLQVQGFKGEADSIFHSFARMKQARDSSGLKGSLMFKLMGSAVGGTSLSEILG